MKYITGLRALCFMIIITEVLCESTPSKITCGSSQVLLRDRCVDCNTLLYGCTACEVVEGKTFLTYTDKPALQCTTCDNGLY